MERVKEQRCFGGTQGTYRHDSEAVAGAMEFAVYVPPGDGPFPVVWFLSGLTCSSENVITKAGAQRVCAELQLALVCPDTSPRGHDYAKDERYWFGEAASYYVDATAEPFAAHYQMFTYLKDELPAVVGKHFPVELSRQCIMGHSMGGHGALMMALKQPDRYASVSAFAPIAHYTACPWGEAAVAGYFGGDADAARGYDVVSLIEAGARPAGPVLIDQGTDDAFVEEQLQPQVLQKALKEAGIGHELRMQAGYDHSYYFVQTFMEEHLRHHHQAVAGG